MFKKLSMPIMIVVLCGLMMQPTTARAGWVDDQIDEIVDRVKEIFNTIVDAKATISDGKIKAMIADVQQTLLVAARKPQEGIDEFMAGGCEPGNLSSECGRFRDDLKMFIQGLEDLNNEFLAFHPLPDLDVQLQDPGLMDLIDLLPGRVLFPMYKILSKLEFFESGLIENLQVAQDNLGLLRMVIFEQEQSALYGGSRALDVEFPDACAVIRERPLAVKGAGFSILGLGIAARILGAAFEAASKTFVAGPVDFDAGIHGYVHLTVKQNWPHIIGAGFEGLGQVLMPIGSYALNKIRFCGLEDGQATMLSNQATILANQETNLANQAELLLGQRRVLCAFKHNLPDACAEFVGNGYGNRGRYLANPGRR